jgi:hypothetical protein
MKTILISLLLSTGAFAQELIPIAVPPSAPRDVAELTRTLRSPRAEVVQIEGDDEALLIPVAGNAPGGNGTFFRTDVTFSNNRSVSQSIGIGWLAQGVDNRSSGIDYFTIPANTFIAVDDFVGGTLHKTGLGAIVVIAVNASGSPDTAAQINAFSRIWTNQPGSAGTVSQTMPSVSLTDSIGSLVADLPGLKQSSQFRSNLGIVNLDTASHTWTARSAATGATTTLTVLPYSMVQVPIVAGSASSSGNVSLTLKSDGFGFWWSAYGTSVDNLTGDGWVSRATQ